MKIYVPCNLKQLTNSFPTFHSTLYSIHTGIWEATQQHALDWSSLSNEDQMLIETISTKLQVDT